MRGEHGGREWEAAGPLGGACVGSMSSRRAENRKGAGGVCVRGWTPASMSVWWGACAWGRERASSGMEIVTQCVCLGSVSSFLFFVH